MDQSEFNVLMNWKPNSCSINTEWETLTHYVRFVDCRMENYKTTSSVGVTQFSIYLADIEEIYWTQMPKSVCILTNMYKSTETRFKYMMSRHLE